MHSARLAILSALFVVCPCVGLAQQNPCLERTVPVGVFTDRGRLVKGLLLANFRAEWRGRPVEIVSASYDTGPRHAVILLDWSGSVADIRDVELFAARALVSEAGEQTSFALVTFAEGVQEQAGFAQDRLLLMDRLRILESSTPLGKTALLDALSEADRLLRPAKTGDAVIVISDGGENRSKNREGNVRTELISSGIRVFAFVPAIQLAGRSRAREEEAGAQMLHYMAQVTGGDDASVQVSRPSVLTTQAVLAAVHGLGQEIDGFYRLELRLPEPIDKPQTLKLEVVETSGQRAKHVQAIYPQQLVPCEPH